MCGTWRGGTIRGNTAILQGNFKVIFLFQRTGDLELLVFIFHFASEFQIFKLDCAHVPSPECDVALQTDKRYIKSAAMGQIKEHQQHNNQTVNVKRKPQALADKL